MYKVFFVDDEASMRAGIRDSIDWDNTGFILAGEAPDGELALSLMDEILPDILITDVKMPFMDGIELSRTAKENMPWIKIIILSGHDEFEYAKQAIAIGVEDYLLKPITSGKLMEILNAVACKIEKERRSNVEKLISSMQDISAIGIIPFPGFDKLPMIEKLRYASKADASRFAEDYLESFDSSAITSLIFLYYIFMDILFSAAKIIEEFGGDAKAVLSEFSDIGGLLNNSSSIDNIKATMTLILEKVIDFRDSAIGSKYNEIIVKAQEYIQKNYADKDISLHSVAKEVSISPSHFSTIFSQETGETFISYITRVRLEQAKLLLKTTQMRTSDIGYDVGYNDTHYFSYVFKKHTGMTPKEFRNV